LPYCGIFVAQLNMSETHLRAEQMTHLAHGITLSGWILVAVLNTGPLWAQESTPLQAYPVEEKKAAVATGDSSASLVVDSDTVTAAPSLDASLLEEIADAEMSYWGIASKLGMGLALVILLAWGAVYLLRKSSVGQQFGGVGQTIRIVERTYLSQKKAIYLVEIGDRTLALGVTEGQINALSEWQAGELELTVEPESTGSFATQFKKLLKSEPQEGRDT